MNRENNMNDFREEGSDEIRSDFNLRATKSQCRALEWHDLICVLKANILVMQRRNWKGKKLQTERKVRQLLH